MNEALTSHVFRARDYDLAATLSSGQAFRWVQRGSSWTGVIGQRWILLESVKNGISAQTIGPISDWTWASEYLRPDEDLDQVLRDFPEDEPMRLAVSTCRGLRLLRQDRWECLASFILSSTKQIVQIRQVIGLLCERYGEPLKVPAPSPPACAFPTAERLASASERDLRACRMGFRAAYLLNAARQVADGSLDLERIRGLPLDAAREDLMRLPGVGRKIADCVLLFAYGFPKAFPADVWILRALRELYFPGRRINPRELHHFVDEYFGPQSGYAQQYLFHYIRTKVGRGMVGISPSVGEPNSKPTSRHEKNA